MDQTSRTNMESQGYLGNSRVILNHFDAATQADIQHTALSYESEDEAMNRWRSRSRSHNSATALYSKQDIREQYCISERGLGALEANRGGGGLFGCLAGAHNVSPCAAAARANLLTVCVRRRVPSDENLYELCRRQPKDYAPMPRYPRYPWAGAPPDLYRYDEDLACAYFRRRPRSLCGATVADPSKYTWLPADEEAGRLERPRSIRPGPDPEMRHSVECLPPPTCLLHPMGGITVTGSVPGVGQPALVQRPKHVSFARSHTLTSFDDAVVSLGTGTGNTGSRLVRSQERLLDGKKTADPPPITRQPEFSDSNRVLVEKLKRAPMKTQATQTEVCLGRKPVPSAQLTLSPRTIHRVKMVSQGAQTNGMLLFNGRKLMKSYSEAGGKFVAEELDLTPDHEPLQRTQSEEPPRSPFIVKTPSPEPDLEEDIKELIPVSNSQTVNQVSPLVPPLSQPPTQTDENSCQIKSDLESEESETKSQKEIIIDFEPQIPSTAVKKKPLLKTSSDGEILLDKRRAQREVDDQKFLPSKSITSISHDNISVEPEPKPFVPYFQNSPIRHEDIFKDLNTHHPIFSSVENDNDVSSFRAQDSIDEEFHENLIYGGLFRKQSSSISDEVGDICSKNGSNSQSPEEDGVVPTMNLLNGRKVSPFASSDSLANDLRDHSDGIWNESQVTVLPADSGAENGNETSGTLDTLSPGSAMLLTPSSRRKHLLLLQHQQRSSMDTDALEEESQVDQQQSQPIIVPTPFPKESSLPTLLPPLLSVEIPHSSSLLRRISGSPSRIRRPTPEPSLAAISATERGYSDSALGDLVPDLLLARTDSGRTNTDVSESTTTEDYMTATSGTDSSRRSGSVKGAAERFHPHGVNQDGSSFESASSIYSLTRMDHLSEDMVVPSFSPPPILEETSDTAPTPVPCASRGSRTASSSSSGSYSLGGDGAGGSCPDLHVVGPKRSPKSLRRSHRTREHRSVPSVSDDERSLRYSSSGYYESPLEDDSTSRTTRTNLDQREWTDEEKKKKKRNFTLDIHKHQGNGDQKSPHKTDRDIEVTTQISPRNQPNSTIDKQPKRTRVRNRSPMQGRRASGAYTTKRSPTGPGLHTPTHHDLASEDAYATVVGNGGATSDESSSGVCGDVQMQVQSQSSPRKTRKIRENNRRKSAPRSPTTSRTKRRNGSGDDKPSSLPGSLPRRRPKHESNTDESAVKSSRLSPYRSPTLSPTKLPSQKPSSPDPPRLKALSAESLRSVSPGSDSVFYSDPSTHTTAPTEHQVHCLHCGKEVDIVTTDVDPNVEEYRRSSAGEKEMNIVQPPAGFADSPRVKHGRLYKKLEKRFRSEERSHAERRHHKYRSDVRAKSEERCSRSGSESKSVSAGASRGAGSSPSLLATSPDVDIIDDDSGVYAQPYRAANWVYIGDSDEMHAWNKSDLNLHQQSLGQEEPEIKRRDSVTSTTSTDSEHEFRKRYEAVTHRMVHRKSCLEMYKRQASKSFESDKTIIVRRESGEFGFRIHGSKPVVVSAIEPDTPAENSGLEVGDIVLSVNGVSVLDKSHNEVVKIAHAGSDTLSLEVARTCGILNPSSSSEPKSTALYAGYLWKQGGHVSGNPTNKWIRRWFCLKKDNCLYSYKTDVDQQPVSALLLINYTITPTTDTPPSTPTRQFCFSLHRHSPSNIPNTPVIHLAADSENAAQRWICVLSRAAEKAKTNDSWLEKSRKYLDVSPCGVKKPDCFGYLNKLGSKWKTWARRYCVLKDACMYFYFDASSNCSYGMACLHGYKVQQSTTGGKKHAFEILPSDTSQKHFYFHTESEMDRKRWLAALEYSIDRWLKIG